MEFDNHMERRLNRAIIITLIIFCIVMASLIIHSITHTTIRLEGTINYQNDKVELTFSPWEAGMPTSLESNDEYFISYAKIHDTEKIECDVLCVTWFDRKYFYIKEIHFE